MLLVVLGICGEEKEITKIATYYDALWSSVNA